MSRQEDPQATTPEAQPGRPTGEPTRIATLNRLVQELAAMQDLKGLADRVLAVLKSCLKPDVAVVYLQEGGELACKSLLSPGPGYPTAANMDLNIGECLCGTAAQEGRPCISKDICADPRCTHLECKQAGIVSFAAMPMVVEGEVIGVLSVGAKAPRDFEEDKDFLALLASILSVNLHRVRLVEESREQARVLESRVMDRTSELTEARKRFSALVQLAPVGIFENDEAGDCILVNSTLAGYMGMPMAQAMGDGWTKALHPEDRPAVEAAWRKTVSEQGLFHMDFRFLSEDGRTTWLTVHSRPVKNDQGKVTGYIGSALDITERKRAENELRKLQRAVEHSQASIVITDPKGVIEYVNPHFTELTGFTREETLGKTPSILKSGRHDKKFYKNLWDTLTSGRVWRGELLNRKKNGELYWEDSVISPVRDDQGATTNYVAVKEDITATKEAERKLKESEERYRRVVEETDNIITQVDGQGRLLFMNRAGEKLFGCPRDACLGRPAFDFIHPEDREATILAFEGWVRDRVDSTTFQNRQVDLDGNVSHLSWIINFHYSDSGELKGVYSIATDVTKQKELEALREDVERIMRHDLKTPLNAIIGLPQAIMDDDNLDPEQRSALGHIIEAGYRMLRSVNMSLDLYRMEVGTYRLNARPVDVNAGVERAVAELAGKAEQRGVAVVKLLPKASPVFLGEESLLHSMLANILDNALDASATGDTVTIKAGGDADGPVLSVHNAQPVPRDVRDRFFDKYATSGKFKGTGLGTYSARLMARTMGGDIEMRTNDKQGTTLTVKLPPDKGGQAQECACAARKETP